MIYSQMKLMGNEAVDAVDVAESELLVPSTMVNLGAQATTPFAGNQGTASSQFLDNSS